LSGRPFFPGSRIGTLARIESAVVGNEGGDVGVRIFRIEEFQHSDDVIGGPEARKAVEKIRMTSQIGVELKALSYNRLYETPKD
jgi:hypothetical protein